MTTDDIIELAHEAGVFTSSGHCATVTFEVAERFAALVRAEDEALLRQALELLEQSETTVPYEGFGITYREAQRKHQAVITALKERLKLSDAIRKLKDKK